MVTCASIDAISVWLALSRNEPVHGPMGSPLIEHPPIVLQGVLCPLTMQPVTGPVILVPNWGPDSRGGKYIHWPTHDMLSCVSSSAPPGPVGAVMVQVCAPSVSLLSTVRFRVSP